ncbi:MAG: ATP-binding protein [Thiotrichales bacterium]
MTLTLRLLLVVVLVVLGLLVSAAFIELRFAKQTVERELDSSAKLTLQLVSAAFIAGQVSDHAESLDILIRHLQQLRNIRHLDIAVLRADGTVIQPFSDNRERGASRVPDWFRRLVAPLPVEYRRRVVSPGLIPSEIVIVPNPNDEIAEVWQEARIGFGLILGFTLLALVLIALTIRQALRPMQRIIHGLEEIEAGDYASRLPRFRLPELQFLAARINHMTEVLERQQGENRALNRRLLEVQEQERRHLARELHDELGQSITALKVMAVGQGRDARGTSAILDVCNQMYAVVREMMHRLRPVMLEELGLVTALERLVDDWNGRHADTFCALQVSGEFDDLGDDSAITLYRIVQEALTNVSRHATASTVSVRLQRAVDGAITLMIQDDGQGFETEVTRMGMGLLGMRERVQALDGKLSLVARPGVGVTIDITIPATGLEQAHEQDPSAAG